MNDGLTLGRPVRRLASLGAGAGMLLAAAVTVQQFFAARYPATRTASPLCDLLPALRCDGGAGAAIAQLGGVPLGLFGVLLGALVVLGAVLPSVALERTNRALALVNAAVVLLLLAFAGAGLNGLGRPGVLYGLLSLLNAALFLRWRDRQPGSAFLPAPVHVGLVAAVLVSAGWTGAAFHDAVRGADEAVVGTRAVSRFYRLPQVPWPSEISRFWTVRSTPEFEAAPIRIVQYADALCSDCQVAYVQLRQLEREFGGQLNVAYQFFPLEAKCNDVVEKDKHPGACDLAYIAAYDPRSFRAVHDEIHQNLAAAKADPEWRLDLARRYGAEAALTDTAVQAEVHRLIATGAEYERTSEKYAHGIRSTPTLIINNRMVIGTLPTADLRAIFRALVEEHEAGSGKFIENWIEPGCVIEAETDPLVPCS